MDKKTQRVIDELKRVIDLNGPDYLTRRPYQVYEELKYSSGVSDKTAALVLYALVNDIPSVVTTDMDMVSLSKTIKKACDLNKKSADILTVIFLGLYSPEHKRSWEIKDREGLILFLKDEFVCRWNGFTVWDEGRGTVDCYYRAEIMLYPTEDVVADKGLLKMLDDNPFTTKEEISDYFRESLREHLDDTFEAYCIADDDYQPVCEEFDVDEYVSEWCDEYGLEMVYCVGSGEDGGYVPKYRRLWL